MKINTLFTMKIHARRLVFAVMASIGCVTPLLAEATTPPIIQPQVSECPRQFHHVIIHKAATQCQHFDMELPASLVYFVADSPEALVAYYLNTMPVLSRHSEHNQRILLLGKGQNTRIVVSPDDAGAQVDILVLAKDIITSASSE